MTNDLNEIGKNAYACIFALVGEMKAADAFGKTSDYDAARYAIREDALEIAVREDWHAPGVKMAPTDFMILITTGGPAVRIRGELNNHSEPCRAWLEVQDWGTPWTEYHDVDEDVLLDYANCFYFGE